MKNIFKAVALVLALSSPFSASAASLPTVDLISILLILGPIIQQLIVIAFSTALLGFFWGIAMFVWNAGNEKKRIEGRNVMIWGIIALFVSLSIFGIISALQTTFKIENVPLTVPCPRLDQNC